MSKRMKIVASAAGLAVWVGVSVGALLVMSGQGQELEAPVTVTGCPSEDSCTADYRDGVWHITAVTP